MLNAARVITTINDAYILCDVDDNKHIRLTSIFANQMPVAVLLTITQAQLLAQVLQKIVSEMEK